jgi:hypothetical protein
VAAAVYVAAGALDDDGTGCELPAPGGDARTRPVECPAIADREAAERVDRTRKERNPENAAANRRRPTASELRRFRTRNDYVPPHYAARVTGDFRGSTDDIIEWAAWKWGIGENPLQALQESDWKSSAAGDDNTSFGVMQIKRTFHAGTFPLSRESTAFNLDYYGAVFRHYFDGKAPWLGDVERGEPYRSGDVWGSVGAHFAGRWHTPPAEAYIRDVQEILREQRWRR